MARLRQQNPNNYLSSGNIHAEFENLIRYLNVAELGNKTLGELVNTLFDEDGEFDGPIDLRLDPTGGLQYRIGEYALPEAGWVTIASIADLRGPAGRDVGTIGAPILYGYAAFSPANASTQIAYAHDATDDLLVYVDGILQVPTDDYTNSSGTDLVTFNSAFGGTEQVVIYKIRATQVTGYHRFDYTTVATQSVFPFVHEESSVLQVYLNGILQASGGGNDYTSNAATDTVTFLSPVVSGNHITILTVENTATSAVTGLMMQDVYTDVATGLILYSKLSIANNAIPQAKVASLAADLAERAKLYVGPTAPVTPTIGQQWQDTSGTQDVLKFWDGTQWVQTSPTSGLPSFTTADAGKRIEVNPLGTGLIYANDDFSALIAVTQKGASNGVATLDSQGRLPASQLPTTVANESIYTELAGAVTNGTYLAKRTFKQQLILVGATFHLTSGTASVQLAVDGVGVGSVYAVTSAGLETSFATTQTVDARATSKRIGFIVSAASSPVDLEVTIAASQVN